MIVAQNSPFSAGVALKINLACVHFSRASNKPDPNEYHTTTQLVRRGLQLKFYEQEESRCCLLTPAQGTVWGKPAAL
jgi:hypothetical protein